MPTRPPDPVPGRQLLTAFWVERDDAAWHGRRLGVSAYSLEDALALLAASGYDVNPSTATVRTDVRVSDLDQFHVVPNMGTIVRRGVWYPNLNGAP